MLLRKLVFCASLVLFSSLSHADLIRISGSGSISSGDFSVFDPAAPNLPDLTFSFSTVFDLNDFVIPFNSPTQTPFLFVNHTTELEVNGLTPPVGFIRNGEFSGGRHVIQNEASIPDPIGGTPASSFELALGVSFEQATRFDLSNQFYIRSASVSGFIADLFPNVGTAADPIFNNIGSPQGVIDATLNDFTDFFSVSARFDLGLTSNPFDNVVGRGTVDLNGDFTIQAELITAQIPEPSPLALIGVMLLAICLRKSLKA